MVQILIFFIFTSLSLFVSANDGAYCDVQFRRITCKSGEVFVRSGETDCKCVSAEGVDKCATGSYYDQTVNGCSDPAGNSLQSNVSSDAAAGAPAGWGECEAAYVEAAQSCNLNANKTVQEAMKTAETFKNQVDVAAMSSLKVACSGMGAVSKAVNAGLGSYKAYCSTGYGSCSSACDSELEKAKAARPSNGVTEAQIAEIRKYKGKCDDLQYNLAQAGQSLQNFMAVDSQMKNCALLMGDPIAQQCAQNPALPVCATMGNSQDCSNPQVAATNLVCVCQRPENRGLAQCQGVSRDIVGMTPPGGSSTTGSGVDGVSNGALGNYGGLGGGYGGSDIVDLPAGKPESGGGGSLSRGGGGRAGVSESGGGNGKQPGGAGGGGGGSGYNSKVIAGYGFGGGGSGGMGGGSGSGSGYSAGGGGTGGIRQQYRGGPDLRQFMPGGKMDPSRSIAGISGPDGITGPNSNIWKKINVRYFSVSSSLLP